MEQEIHHQLVHLKEIQVVLVLMVYLVLQIQAVVVEQELLELTQALLQVDQVE